MRATRLFPILALAAIACAQDEVRVSSPNGQIDFRLGVATPNVPGALPGLAYQVQYRGKPLIDTSYLGYAIHVQVPLLGENVGLVASHARPGNGYNELAAEYMQNGSLGRKITVEVRAYDTGVAFRYEIPQSTLLMEVLIEDEVTEFRFARDAQIGGAKLPGISPEARLEIPLVVELPGAGWVSISEAGGSAATRMFLRHYEGNILVTRLPQFEPEPRLAVRAKSPWVSPWRVLSVGASRETVLNPLIRP